MISELIVVVVGLIVAIGAVTVSAAHPVTKGKLKLIAILYGITGITCLSLAYLTFEQALWYDSSGFMILAVITIIVGFVVRNKYNELGKTAS